MSNEPNKNLFEPLTALVEAANSLHELYISYLAAGFTTDEALKLLASMIKDA